MSVVVNSRFSLKAISIPSTTACSISAPENPSDFFANNNVRIIVKKEDFRH